MRTEWLIMATVLVTLRAPGLWAEDSAKPAAREATTLSVLTIGNSFAGNALRFLPQIAESVGYQVIVGRANLGGCSLQRHWEMTQAFDKSPDDPKGRYGGKDANGVSFAGESLQQKLASRKWDFVTIQQYSMFSHSLATYEPYTKNLIGYIRKYAPGVCILIHHTWAYRVDDAQFNGSAKEGQPTSQKEMYQKVHSAYTAISEEHDLQVIPSGPAFFMVDSNSQWGFKPDPDFNPKSAAAGALPNQAFSLHVGYWWRKGNDGKDTLEMDCHHASTAGEYLAGLCFFEKMSGVDSNRVSFVPKRVAPEFAAFLRKIAHEAINAKE